jgi:hypothetical protein
VRLGGCSGARPRPSRCAAAHLGRGRVILGGAFGLPGRRKGWRALCYGSTAEAATRGSGRQEQPHARTQCPRGAPVQLALGPLVLLAPRASEVIASPRCPCCTSAERFEGDLSSGTRRSLELGVALMEADEVREAVGEGRSAQRLAPSCAAARVLLSAGRAASAGRAGRACNPYVRWIPPKSRAYCKL